MKKVLTVCFIHQHPRILLGLKKRGFGMGRWNGFGGKLQPGETIEAAAKREVQEEAGVVVSNIEKVGLIDFEFKDNPEILEVHFFRANDFSGTPTESDEMKPQWFSTDNLPFDSMWPDDRYWMPLFLAGKKFKGKIFFADMDTITKTELSVVQEV
jgi:8-oxo-dGTP diphosphatase/2-hydroxy-dATP diphosphatase